MAIQTKIARASQTAQRKCVAKSIREKSKKDNTTSESKRFPSCEEELKFARISFTAPRSGGKFDADFILGNGVFLSLVFDRIARGLDAKAITVTAVKILEDPMTPRSQPQLERAAIEELRLPGWIEKALARQSQTDEVWIFRPLQHDVRQMFLRRIEARLPQDYIELLDACEGFRTEEWSVSGASKIHEISLDGGDYYVLAEHNGNGVLGVKAKSDERALVYLSFSDGEPRQAGTTVREGLSSWSREGGPFAALENVERSDEM